MAEPSMGNVSRAETEEEKRAREAAESGFSLAPQFPRDVTAEDLRPTPEGIAAEQAESQEVRDAAVQQAATEAGLGEYYRAGDDWNAVQDRAGRDRAAKDARAKANAWVAPPMERDRSGHVIRPGLYRDPNGQSWANEGEYLNHLATTLEQSVESGWIGYGAEAPASFAAQRGVGDADPERSEYVSDGPLPTGEYQVTPPPQRGEFVPPYEGVYDPEAYFEKSLEFLQPYLDRSYAKGRERLATQVGQTGRIGTFNTAAYANYEADQEANYGKLLYELYEAAQSGAERDAQTELAVNRFAYQQFDDDAKFDFNVWKEVNNIGFDSHKFTMDYALRLFEHQNVSATDRERLDIMLGQLELAQESGDREWYESIIMGIAEIGKTVYEITRLPGEPTTVPTA